MEEISKLENLEKWLFDEYKLYIHKGYHNYANINIVHGGISGFCLKNFPDKFLSIFCPEFVILVQ